MQDTRVVLEKVDYEAVIAQSEMQLCALEDDECMDSIKGFLEDVGIAVAGEREKENAKEKKEDGEASLLILLECVTAVFIDGLLFSSRFM